MNIKYKILITAIILITVLSACCGLYYYVDNRMDTSTIDYIKSMQRSANRFLDLANDINVESADDLGFIVRGHYDIDIYYGDQVIRMTKKCFESKEYREKLAAIGVNVYTHVSDDDPEDIMYRVTYWGEEIDQLSLVD